jgi:hypothetical protein
MNFRIPLKNELGDEQNMTNKIGSWGTVVVQGILLISYMYEIGFEPSNAFDYCLAALLYPTLFFGFGVSLAYSLGLVIKDYPLDAMALGFMGSCVMLGSYMVTFVVTWLAVSYYQIFSYWTSYSVPEVYTYI